MPQALLRKTDAIQITPGNQARRVVGGSAALRAGAAPAARYEGAFELLARDYPAGYSPSRRPISRLDLLSKTRLNASKPKNSRLSDPSPPPPPLFVSPAALAFVNSTFTCALAAGGAPEHVIA
jgi:hypothetical protein